MIMSLRNRGKHHEVYPCGCCGQKPSKKMKRKLKRSERNRINRQMWMEWN